MSISLNELFYYINTFRKLTIHIGPYAIHIGKTSVCLIMSNIPFIDQFLFVFAPTEY